MSTRGSGPENASGALREPSYTRAAAWLPHTEANKRNWRDNEQAIVDWIRMRADAEAARLIVFVNSLNAARPDGSPLERLVRAHGVTHPREQLGIAERTCVIAAYPDAKSLAQSTVIAHDASLAVIESVVGLPLAGWAQGIDASDVSLDPQVHPRLTAAQTEALDRLIAETGNNNWTGPDDQAFAKRVLKTLPGLDADLAVGYVLSDVAVNETGEKILRRLIAGVSSS